MAGKYLEQLNKKISTRLQIIPYNITLSMLKSLLLSKVATIKNAIHSRPYFHICISVSQLVRNMDSICWHRGFLAFDFLSITGILEILSTKPVMHPAPSLLRGSESRKSYCEALPHWETR